MRSIFTLRQTVTGEAAESKCSQVSLGAPSLHSAHNNIPFLSFVSASCAGKREGTRWNKPPSADPRFFLFLFIYLFIYTAPVVKSEVLNSDRLPKRETDKVCSSLSSARHLWEKISHWHLSQLKTRAPICCVFTVCMYALFTLFLLAGHLLVCIECSFFLSLSVKIVKIPQRQHKTRALTLVSWRFAFSQRAWSAATRAPGCFAYGKYNSRARPRTGNLKGSATSWPKSGRSSRGIRPSSWNSTHPQWPHSKCLPFPAEARHLKLFFPRRHRNSKQRARRIMSERNTFCERTVSFISFSLFTHTHMHTRFPSTTTKRQMHQQQRLFSH